MAQRGHSSCRNSPIVDSPRSGADVDGTEACYTDRMFIGALGRLEGMWVEWKFVSHKGIVLKDGFPVEEPLDSVYYDTTALSLGDYVQHIPMNERGTGKQPRTGPFNAIVRCAKSAVAM